MEANPLKAEQPRPINVHRLSRLRGWKSGKRGSLKSLRWGGVYNIREGNHGANGMAIFPTHGLGSRHQYFMHNL